MLFIANQPVWERSTEARVQLLDPLFLTCYWLSGKGKGCAPSCIARKGSYIEQCIFFQKLCGAEQVPSAGRT